MLRQAEGVYDGNSTPNSSVRRVIRVADEYIGSRVAQLFFLAFAEGPMIARSLAAVCFVLFTAAVAASAPIRYIVSTADTAFPLDGRSLGAEVVNFDATLDHMTGFAGGETLAEERR